MSYIPAGQMFSEWLQLFVDWSHTPLAPDGPNPAGLATITFIVALAIRLIQWTSQQWGAKPIVINLPNFLSKIKTYEDGYKKTVQPVEPVEAQSVGLSKIIFRFEQVLAPFCEFDTSWIMTDWVRTDWVKDGVGGWQKWQSTQPGYTTLSFLANADHATRFFVNDEEVTDYIPAGIKRMAEKLLTVYAEQKEVSRFHTIATGMDGVPEKGLEENALSRLGLIIFEAFRKALLKQDHWFLLTSEDYNTIAFKSDMRMKIVCGNLVEASRDACDYRWAGDSVTAILTDKQRLALNKMAGDIARNIPQTVQHYEVIALALTPPKSGDNEQGNNEPSI